MNHIDDPLAYLYEELPPREMEEARAHLLACPSCRERVGTVREGVKLYREIPRPAPPGGLALRAAAALARQMDAMPAIPGMAEKPPALRDEPPSAPERGDGWRRTLFHPAWTVAAGMLLLCAALIHISPRRDFWFDARPAAVAPAPRDGKPAEPAAAGSAAVRERVRLPARMERAEPRPAAPEPPSPILAEAEALAAPLPALSLPARDPAMRIDSPGNQPSDPVHAAADTENSARHEQLDLASVTSLFKSAAEKQAGDIRTEPHAFPAEEDGETGGTTGTAEAAGKEADAPDGGDDGAAVAAAMTAVVPDAISVEELDAFSRDAGHGISVEMPEDFTPPIVVRRPEAMDGERAVKNLVFLTGLHMGDGDLSAAAESIKLLRNYDPARADELETILANMPRTAPAEETPMNPAETETAALPPSAMPETPAGPAASGPDMPSPPVPAEPVAAVTEPDGETLSPKPEPDEAAASGPDTPSPSIPAESRAAAEPDSETPSPKPDEPASPPPETPDAAMPGDTKASPLPAVEPAAAPPPRRLKWADSPAKTPMPFSSDPYIRGD